MVNTVANTKIIFSIFFTSGLESFIIPILSFHNIGHSCVQATVSKLVEYLSPVSFLYLVENRE